MGVVVAVIGAVVLGAGIAGAGMMATGPTVLIPPTTAPVCIYYPVVIHNPGSYVLGGNLILPCDKNGIEIQADNVVLDLGGFSIIGKGLSGAGTGVFGPTHFNISVKNGSVINMPGTGISLGANATIADVTISGAGTGDGIQIATGTVRRAHSTANKQDGIDIVNSTFPSTIADSDASFNQKNGIDAYNAVISGNTAASNTSVGINCPKSPPTRCAILGNVVESNGGAGISGVGTIANNTSSNNGKDGISGIGQITNNTVTGNTGAGIVGFDGPSSVTTNSVGMNGGFGIDAGVLSSFGNNQIFENNGETSSTHKTQPQTSGGVQITPNICDGNTVCPGP